MNNLRWKGADSLHSEELHVTLCQRSTSAVLQLRIQPTADCVIPMGKKSAYKWACEVQTCVVQRINYIFLFHFFLFFSCKISTYVYFLWPGKFSLFLFFNSIFKNLFVQFPHSSKFVCSIFSCPQLHFQQHLIFNFLFANPSIFFISGVT